LWLFKNEFIATAAQYDLEKLASSLFQILLLSCRTPSLLSVEGERLLAISLVTCFQLSRNQLATSLLLKSVALLKEHSHTVLTCLTQGLFLALFFVFPHNPQLLLNQEKLWQMLQLLVKLREAAEGPELESSDTRRKFLWLVYHPLSSRLVQARFHLSHQRKPFLVHSAAEQFSGLVCLAEYMQSAELKLNQ